MKLFALVMAIYVTHICYSQKSISIIDSLIIDSIGACQGVHIQKNGIVYLYGDREVGIIRKYQLKNHSLQYLNEEIRLTKNDTDVINHPTGFALTSDGKILIGNSSRLNKEDSLWKADIFYIDWNKLQQFKTLDKSLIKKIDDDACVQGTRPEFLTFRNQQFIATADYGGKNNEVRLYGLNKLKASINTSTKGVVKYKFKCSPWVQNLKWLPDKNILILIQNQIEGKYWRLTFIDLEKSIRNDSEFVINQIDIDKSSELEGLDFTDNNSAIAVTSSKNNNLFFLKINW